LLLLHLCLYTPNLISLRYNVSLAGDKRKISSWHLLSKAQIDFEYGTGRAEPTDGLLDEDVHGDPSTARPAIGGEQWGLGGKLWGYELGCTIPTQNDLTEPWESTLGFNIPTTSHKFRGRTGGFQPDDVHDFQPPL
jgi:hypothetical protein